VAIIPHDVDPLEYPAEKALLPAILDGISSKMCASFPVFGKRTGRYEMVEMGHRIGENSALFDRTNRNASAVPYGP